MKRQVLKASVWDEILKDPLWYNDDAIKASILTYFANPTKGKKSESWHTRRKSVLSYFTERLANGAVALGEWPRHKNDDDRVIPGVGMIVDIDTIVVHHTATAEDITYDELNALGLLRLYAPLFINRVFDKEGEPYQPISSGHFYRGVQTFVGYHAIIYPNGDVKHLLGWEDTGFQAGHWHTNIKSVSFAFVGTYTHTTPSFAAISAARWLIQSWRADGATNIVAHKDVRTGTECPGKIWPAWKHLLTD